MVQFVSRTVSVHQITVTKRSVTECTKAAVEAQVCLFGMRGLCVAYVLIFIIHMCQCWILYIRILYIIIANIKYVYM